MRARERMLEAKGMWSTEMDRSSWPRMVVRKAVTRWERRLGRQVDMRVGEEGGHQP